MQALQTGRKFLQEAGGMVAALARVSLVVSVHYIEAMACRPRHLASIAELNSGS